MTGNPSAPVCGISVGLNRVGMILLGGLTPVAAAAEAGIEADNQAMSTLLDYKSLIKFQELI
jgi:repressor of nif and glnA expression